MNFSEKWVRWLSLWNVGGLHLEQLRISFLNHLVEWRMKAEIVSFFYYVSIFALFFQAHVTFLHCFYVALNRKLSVYSWVLWVLITSISTWLWLVEIVCVFHKSCPLQIENYLPIWSYQQSHCSCPASTTSWSIFVHCDVGSHYYSVSSIPKWRGYPVKSINQGICSSITSINARDT